MNYHDQLHPWVVYRLLPHCRNVAIARFRRRNDASMYLITVQRYIPHAQFIIAFDPPVPPTPVGAKHSALDTSDRYHPNLNAVP